VRVATLERRIGVLGAGVIGVSAMVGSGVFFVWAPATAAAGGWMLLGLAIAAAVATLNALSTAQLATAHPRSGGVYTFAGEAVNGWFGFAAGWLFLTGKIASAGASALIAGLYLWPAAAKWVAVAVVVLLALVNASGIRSTVVVSGVLLAIVVGGLLTTLGLGWSGGVAAASGASATGGFGILQAAALIFFAFAGYARIATLGEEVVEPRKTIPRAVVVALGTTLVIYAAVATTCLVVLGPTALAASDAPLADLVSGPWRVVVPVLAAIAAVGSLLGVLAGLSRTGLAMARGGDLPSPLARVAERTRTPVIAELVIAVVIMAVVLLLDPLILVGFSACAVLGYYAIAHLAAFRQPTAERRLPRWVQVAGGIACVALAVTLPWLAVVVTVGLLAIALAARAGHRTFNKKG
jgi:APA family basic amino acid/polyamine antiporter